MLNQSLLFYNLVLQACFDVVELFGDIVGIGGTAFKVTNLLGSSFESVELINWDAYFPSARTLNPRLAAQVRAGDLPAI